MDPNNYFNTVGNSVQTSIQGLWVSFIQFIPELIAAIIIFIVGFAIASLLANILRSVINKTKIDSAIDKSGIEAALHTGNISISGIIAWVVKWFVIIATLISVADILHLPQITALLNQIVFYLPNVIVAVVIVAAGLVLANMTDNIIERLLGVSGFSESQKKTLGRLSRYAIIVFAVTAALIQLKIATELITLLFGGIVLTLALAFGLGGRDHASRLLDKIEKKKP